MAFRKIQATNLNSVETSFTDAIMVLNKSGTAGQDVGWLGKTGVNTYSGLVKDSTDNLFYLIDNVTLGSQQQNDINPANISKGNLVVETVTANAFEGKLYDTIGNVILDNTTGNVGIGGKTAHFNEFHGELHGEVIHETTGAKVIDMQYSTPIYTGNVIGVLEGKIYDPNGNVVLDNGSINGTPNFGGTVSGDVYVSDNFVLPKGTAAQRPASPEEGQMWFNTTTKKFEVWNGTAWVQLVPSTYVETP